MKKIILFPIFCIFLNNKENFKKNLFEVYSENNGSTNIEKPGSIEKIYILFN